MHEVLNATSCPFDKIQEYNAKYEAKRDAKPECAACLANMQYSDVSRCVCNAVLQRRGQFVAAPPITCRAKYVAAPAQHGLTHIACVRGAGDPSSPCTNSGAGGRAGGKEAEALRVEVQETVAAAHLLYITKYVSKG